MRSLTAFPPFFSKKRKAWKFTRLPQPAPTKFPPLAGPRRSLERFSPFHPVYSMRTTEAHDRQSLCRIPLPRHPPRALRRAAYVSGLSKNRKTNPDRVRQGTRPTPDSHAEGARCCCAAYRQRQRASARRAAGIERRGDPTRQAGGGQTNAPCEAILRIDRDRACAAVSLGNSQAGRGRGETVVRLASSIHREADRRRVRQTRRRAGNCDRVSPGGRRS